MAANSLCSYTAKTCMEMYLYVFFNLSEARERENGHIAYSKGVECVKNGGLGSA